MVSTVSSLRALHATYVDKRRRGGIGPARLYSIGAPYGSITIGFLVGAILPFPVYYLAKRFPKSGIRHFNVPVVGLIGFNLHQM